MPWPNVKNEFAAYCFLTYSLCLSTQVLGNNQNIPPIQPVYTVDHRLSSHGLHVARDW